MSSSVQKKLNTKSACTQTQVEGQAISRPSPAKTNSNCPRKMQKNLGHLRALAEQDPGNILFYCLLNCLIWDKIGMHRVHGVQITIACFSSWSLWLCSPLQGPAFIQPSVREKPAWEQGVSKSNLLWRLNRTILIKRKKHIPVPTRHISLWE